MPDPQVLLQPTAYYHLYNHAVGDENLFEREEDYLYFLRKAKEYLVPVTDILAYCLLPNHFHFVIRLKTHEQIESVLQEKMGKEKFEKQKKSRQHFLNEEISRIYGNFFNTYAKHYNFKKGRMGTLFKRTFRRKEIETTKYLLRLICYVHQNPVVSGFAEKPEKWKYSSYEAMLSSKPTLVIRDEVIELFGDLNNLRYCHLKYEDIDIG